MILSINVYIILSDYCKSYEITNVLVLFCIKTLKEAILFFSLLFATVLFSICVLVWLSALSVIYLAEQIHCK